MATSSRGLPARAGSRCWLHETVAVRSHRCVVPASSPDPHTLLLYTRGSIPYFRTYPGMYVPQPLLLRPARDSTDLQAEGTGVLALSKMNWNSAQLDERDPLTLRTAHRVGAILRHIRPDAGSPPATPTTCRRYPRPGESRWGRG